jgi:pyruvate dehydrogenase E2 component (dihydrolipoamide acetyltransferase)
MPKWGIEMTEGTIAEWMVSAGDRIKRGDMICLIETDKITNEVEAEQDAVVLRILTPASDEALPVGALLAVLGDESTPADAVDAFVAGFVPSESGIGEAPVQAEAKPAVAPEPVRIETSRPISPQALALAEREAASLDAIEGSGRGARITYQDVQQSLRPATAPTWRGPADLPPELPGTFASPIARRLAAQHQVDLAALTGTGPGGRVSKHDVLAAAPQAAVVGGAGNEPRIEPFDKIRKVIAQRLSAAKREIPHFYLRVAVDADALLALRSTTNQSSGLSASINDYLVLATAKALALHPEVNVQVHGDALHHFPHADIAIAVASPKGLVTPIVRMADRLALPELAAATSALIAKAKAGRLAYDDLDGGTFTISNLGMFGIDEFDAVINPPQAAILAVGQARREVVESPGGGIGFATRLRLTLSVDHRAIDGATGAQFLATLKGLIESPGQLIG